MRAIFAAIALIGVAALLPARASGEPPTVAADQAPATARVRLHVSAGESLVARFSRAITDYSAELPIQVESMTSSASGASAAVELAAADARGIPLAGVEVTVDGGGATLWIATTQPARLWTRRIPVAEDAAEAVEQVGVVTRWALTALLARDEPELEPASHPVPPSKRRPQRAAVPRPAQPQPLRSRPSPLAGLALNAAFVARSWSSSAGTPLLGGARVGALGCSERACASLAYTFVPGFEVQAADVSVALREFPVQSQLCYALSLGPVWLCTGGVIEWAWVRRSTVRASRHVLGTAPDAGSELYAGPSVRAVLPLASIFSAELGGALGLGVLRREYRLARQDAGARPAMLRPSVQLGILVRVW